MKNLADLADLADMCPTMCTVHDALRKTTIMKQVDKIIRYRKETVQYSLYCFRAGSFGDSSDNERVKGNNGIE